MNQKKKQPNAKTEARALRKKLKRIVESRDGNKKKSREKGKIIKKQQDRGRKFQRSRDAWKDKCKEEKKKNKDLTEKLKATTSQLEMNNEELQEVHREFEEFKKKIP